MKEIAGGLQCKNCKATLAIYKMSNKAAMERAMAETFGSVCPNCGKYTDKDSVLLLMIFEDTADKVIKLAQKAGILYD